MSGTTPLFTRMPSRREQRQLHLLQTIIKNSNSEHNMRHPTRIKKVVLLLAVFGVYYNLDQVLSQIFFCSFVSYQTTSDEYFIVKITTTGP
jgi:hypothetical protein